MCDINTIVDIKDSFTIAEMYTHLNKGKYNVNPNYYAVCTHVVFLMIALSFCITGYREV